MEVVSLPSVSRRSVKSVGECLDKSSKSMGSVSSVDGRATSDS